MRGIVTSMVVMMACLGLAACGGGGDDGSGSEASESASTTMAATTGASATGTTTGTGSETGSETGAVTGGEQALKGLPEGVSTWKGQGIFYNRTIPLEFEITNTHGDLAVTISMTDPEGTDLGLANASFTATGTHHPAGGFVTISPNDWTVEPTSMRDLIGFAGTYDPAMKRLTGLMMDFAVFKENAITGGAATLDLVSGDGAATALGAEDKSLVVGSQNFSGSTECTKGPRDVKGTLVYDGTGGVSGSITLGDPDLATPFGTFNVIGVHNPSTGGLTLAPREWTDCATNFTQNFFIDGTFDPATKKFDGDQWTNSAACPLGTWHVVFE